MDCTEPAYWDERYAENRMPWDMHGVPPVLIDFLQHNATKGSALIPGCGSGYEVRAFRNFGWNVLAVDFAAAAIERAKTVLGAQADAVRLGDFFSADLGGPFDVIYERTFLCSLPPKRWPEYVRRTAKLLRPKGRLVGLFAYGEEAEPPPFPLPRPNATALFGKHFFLAEDQAIPAAQSLPLFAGKERWQVWRRK